MQDQHDRFAREMRPPVSASTGCRSNRLCRSSASTFLRRLLQRDSLAFFRVMVSEGRKLPPHMRKYFASGGSNLIHDELTKFLSQAGLSDAGAKESVDYFIELLRSHHHFQAIADESYVVSDADLKAHVARSVRFLLNGLKLA
jgi:hypothetical protein